MSTTGRRKTAIARIRLFEGGKNQIIVNDKDYRDYFQVESMQIRAREALDKMKLVEKFDISVMVKGGGMDSQAEAVRHGIARALVKIDETYKKRLRKEGLLTRDSRMKERKKPGLKRARKAPRWSKR
ncbi:MAG: 30S ribosomal protein S9 [Candidatus Pacebacteria bacterium]|nr:30S ribosomal protein S9 [Candidatus Paceibacterota bacterium]